MPVLIGVATVNLSLLGLASINFIPWPIQIIIALLLGLTTHQLIVRARQRGNQRKEVYSQVYRALSICILALLATSVFTAAKSIESDDSIKFILENTSIITGCTAVIVIFILAGLQKEIYWISRINARKLDEREIKERQEVFEKSYKYGTLIVLIAMHPIASLIYTAPHDVVAISSAAPWHVLWIPLSVGVLLFALPLIIAAFKKIDKPLP